MEKDIVEGSIGQIGSYDVEFKGGKLIAVVMAEKAELGISAGVKVEIKAEAVIDALAAAIPGSIDDAIFGVLKAALLKV